MIILTATFHAKPGCGTALQAVLQAMLAPSRKEPGCLSYTLLNAIEQPQTFLFQEQFKDEAAFTAHTQTPHFKQMIQAVAPLLQQDPQIEFFTAVAE